MYQLVNQGLLEEAYAKQDDIAFGLLGYIPIVHLFLANEKNSGYLYRERRMVNGVYAMALRQVDNLDVILVLMWLGFANVFAKGSYLKQLSDFDFVFDRDG